MRIAIVHDWLTFPAGAERVLHSMLSVLPKADLFSLVDFLPHDSRDVIFHKKVQTSFIQKLPRAKKWYRHYLPLMPLAVEQFDMQSYDLVISSSHAVAKGVITGPNQRHICLCYTPMRYAWDLQHQYLREANLTAGVKGMIAKILLHRMRLWDLRTVNGVDQFIAISGFIASRIRKIYAREATVIYPPVDIEDFSMREEKESFYLAASRMVPYKKMDLIVQAFNAMPQKQLVVIGDGPMMKQIKEIAKPNIHLLGFQPLHVMRDYMQRAKAFVFAAIEDFGIIPLEAQACGTPVIALKGGALPETIVGLDDENPTGVFFQRQEIEQIIDAVHCFEQHQERMTARACRLNAERFSKARFCEQFRTFVEA